MYKTLPAGDPGPATKEEEGMKKVLMAMVAVALVAMAGSAMAADSASVTVSASIAGNCRFSTNTGTVSFGTLDPEAGGNVSGTVTQPVFWCTRGTAYTIGDDVGLHETGSTYRMVHATSATDFIPYTFAYTATGTGAGAGIANRITMNIAAQVLDADYINALAGSYSDTVTLTISP
jgi:spore coat protein U-like protein